jgi:hypothetical protein
MPLHRDIQWIGKQWAVTGHGMQLIDQKQKGSFDIEASRLWEEALIDGVRAQQWVDVADFDRGLEVARTRYKDPSRAVAPPVEAMISPAPAVAPLAPLAAAPSIAPMEPLPDAATPLPVVKRAEPAPREREAIAPEKSVPREFQMRFLGHAKFVRPWRVAMKK